MRRDSIIPISTGPLRDMSHYPSPAKEKTEVSTAAIGRNRGCSITTNDTRSLIEALSFAALQGTHVTTITAKNCGVAFLDNWHDILPELEQTMSHVRSLRLCTDLATRDVFKWEQGKLALLATSHRRNSLRRATLEGLLGRFLAVALSLEILVINLQCHQLSNAWVDENDLDSTLGSGVWHHLRHLELRGINTSEHQLADMIYRHRETLQYLTLSDIVLKAGNWHSFFRNMRVVLCKSHLSRANFHLAGSLYFRGSSSNEGLCWDLTYSDSSKRNLGELLADSMFDDLESTLLVELQQLADLAISTSPNI